MKKQLEVSVDERVDFGVFVGLYPTMELLVVLPFVSVAIRDRYGKSWFRFTRPERGKSAKVV